MVGRHEKGKYLIRADKVYDIKPKHQDEWRNRSSHVRYLLLDIWCICIKQQQCGESRWGKTCSNKCPCINYGKQWKCKKK